MWDPRYLASGLTLSLLLAALPARADEVTISPEARTHFKAGVNFVDDPDGARYEEAYREFKVAYSLSPSWKILGNLGLAALKLERDGEAIDAYKKYLAQGGGQIDPDERAQIERDLSTLEAGVIHVDVKSTPAGAVYLDERFPDSGAAVTNRYGPATDVLNVGIRPGRHRITAHVDGYQDSSWTFDTSAGGKFAHTFELKEANGSTPGSTPPGGSPPADKAEESRPVPASVFIFGGTAVAFAAGGAVVGILAQGKHSEYEDLNSDLQSDQDVKEAKDLKDSGETLNLVADGLFAGAIVTGTIAVVLYATRPTEKKYAALHYAPVLAPGFAGATLGGHF